MIDSIYRRLEHNIKFHSVDVEESQNHEYHG